MRWRPGSDGREPRERRKWLEINGVPSRARFRMFIRNRLWIGLPPAFVAGFGVVLLLLVSGGESTPERSLVRASIAGSLCVFGWILGVWAATGPDSEPVAENSEQASGDRFAPRKLRWWLWILCGGAAICYAVFSPSIGRIVEGERTVLEGAAEIVSKVLTVVCVIVPVWLAERARRYLRPAGYAARVRCFPAGPYLRFSTLGCWAPVREVFPGVTPAERIFRTMRDIFLKFTLSLTR